MSEGNVFDLNRDIVRIRNLSIHVPGDVFDMESNTFFESCPSPFMHVYPQGLSEEQGLEETGR